MHLKRLSPAFFAGLLLLLWACQRSSGLTELEPGMIIEESMTVLPGTYQFSGSENLDHPVLSIRGDNIVVDFNGAELSGTTDPKRPDLFQGLAIRVEEGSNITIKNLKVGGYKVGLMAEGVDSLKILDSDFSYNYRQHLGSRREREDLSDWLSYHDNENDEWLRYGAGIYLKHCQQALVKGNRITGGQNGLMLTGCNNGLFYNNTFHFNSGVGIGLYRSSGNRVMHNRLDWNVRGYSHGIYSRGQDSAGILCYEQSSENIFAYNSATHSGDGFFLWAGQETIDTGTGGCNDNIIYRNNFSYAPTNGVEVTFSRNDVVENTLENCRYGIWAGYSYQSRIIGNRIANNEFGVAVENGHDNTINSNYFLENETGVRLWERDQQPEDWAFAKNQDVSSRNYEIEKNGFADTEIPLKISSTDEVNITGNTFIGFDELLQASAPNDNLRMYGNTMNQTMGWGAATPFLDENTVHLDAVAEPPSTEQLYNTTPLQPLADAMDTSLPESTPQGKSFIIIDEWGPYDFRRPGVWLRGIEKDKYVFLLLGPQGNWKLAGGEGFEAVNPKTGAFPATVTARRAPDADLLRLNFEFIGEEVTTQFGEVLKRGTPVSFDFSRFEHPFNWWVRFYDYSDERDPLNHYEAFRALRDHKAGYELETDTLAYVWWRSPGGGIAPDHFATFAETDFSIPSGTYRLTVTSDDGVRLYLDGELLIDHWDIHTPAVDVVETTLGGRHRIEIEHFDAGGLATLDFRIEPVVVKEEGVQ